MNKETIKKLRRKFTWIAFFSFLTVMLLMGAMIYLINHLSSMRQINETLNYITANNGDLSDWEHQKNNSDGYNANNDFDKFWSDMFGSGMDSSPEFKFATRYFSVFLSGQGDVHQVITTNIAAVSRDEVITYGLTAFLTGNDYGKIDQYYYQVSETDTGILIVFVDGAYQDQVSQRLLRIILVLVLIGALGMFFLVRILSKRMIQPEIRNAERQKQFITNAGHELKTPLAVIKANTELDMMINGENEWNQSTLRQTEQMTDLIRDLIMIARAEEGGKSENMIETDLSQVVREKAESFVSVARQAEKTLTLSITEGLKMKAEEGKMQQLTGLLVDNAIKYCDDKGTITVELTAKGKHIRLVVMNDYKDGSQTDCSRFFERFYRADESHNNKKSGYGIGLSIAEGIVKSHKGTIRAVWNNGIIRFICTFPR